MAKNAKGKKSNFVVWGIVLLLIVGFAGFGATGLGGQIQSIGSVGDTEISVNRYARELDQELRAFGAQVGRPVTLNEARQFGIDRNVLQRLVSGAALENEVTRIGLSIGDEEVHQQVLTSPGFVGLNGDFDRDAYEFTLDQAGMTPAGYEDLLRVTAARGILETAVLGGLRAPDAYATLILNYVGERRNFSWVELDEATLTTPVPTPDEATLRTFYDANTDVFMLPDTKKLTYALLLPDTLIDQVAIDEDTLRALYDERDADFNRPERRLVERLIFATDAEADAAVAALAGGTTFDTLVTERGLALSDVDLGDVRQDELGAAADTVFALTEPGIAGPTQTDLGPALFRVNAILPAQSTPFADVADTLRTELAADRARRIVSDQIGDFDDLLAGGATLEELADETDMALGQIDWTSETTDGIAAYTGFSQAAAQVAQGDFPEIVELADGGVFALRLDSLIAAHPEPFEDAREAVQAAWHLDQVGTRLGEEAAVLNAQLENGARIGTLGHPVTVETHITRAAFIENTDPALMEKVFELDAGESALIQAAGKVWIIQLREVLAPDADSPQAEAVTQAVASETAQGIARDLLAAFTSAIEADAGISLNQAALNSIHAQFP
ncbi:MAG: SurA N-terminal domain-containing protein [Marinosulfonomonas sp.]|nr:SurA N-terminal domain-containing protein [Marinosulfonomonas sp.]